MAYDPHIFNNQEVVVTDIKMPFASMVLFMIKWAIASIPAFIILSIIGAVAWTIIVGFFQALLRSNFR